MPTIIGDRKLANNAKALLIADVHSSKNEPAMLSMLKLIDLLKEEVRDDNDSAEGNDIYRNQGSIRICNLLIGYVLRDMPTTNANN